MDPTELGREQNLLWASLSVLTQWVYVTGLKPENREYLDRQIPNTKRQIARYLRAWLEFRAVVAEMHPPEEARIAPLFSDEQAIVAFAIRVWDLIESGTLHVLPAEAQDLLTRAAAIAKGR